MKGVSVKDFTVPAITQGGTLYTDSYKFERVDELAMVLISSTAGSISINQQVSFDGKTFYDAYSPSGELLGKVCEGQGVDTGKVLVFNPVQAYFMRFKIVEDDIAASTVTIKLLFREEL